MHPWPRNLVRISEFDAEMVRNGDERELSALRKPPPMKLPHYTSTTSTLHHAQLSSSPLVSWLQMIPPEPFPYVEENPFDGEVDEEEEEILWTGDF